MGRLTICDRAPGHSTKVICQCSCGNYTVISAQSFFRETTKSCGCYLLEQKRQTMKEIGEKAYYKDYSNRHNPYYLFKQPVMNEFVEGCQVWEIECKKCHRVYEEVPAQLVSETRPKGNNPCECWRKARWSKGVYKIISILEKEKIRYEMDKSFDSLYFDFYLPDNNILIEDDGEQHYMRMGTLTEEELEEKLTKQKKYDIIKNRWVYEHNIRLFRIPYWDYANINSYEDIINIKYEVKE